ncbi:MAG: 3'-phosphoesterase [Candidatus Eremiobacteraeota bacterium]|nr:3'-phosphoesterase [Candidatus Eremiobacteraeota bacterium]
MPKTPPKAKRLKPRTTVKPLAQYEAKRDFERTPEPRAQRSPSFGRALRFVVQKHRATRLHYDFRLEADGVLKSWAVPKGPSLDPADKRLAMQVEDHPFDYRDFEGVIPADNYGAGEVIVWDKGTYKLAEGIDAAQEIAGGKIKFIMKGKKLSGMFTLVKMRGRNQSENAWLLIKDKDSGVDTSWRAEDHGESVKTGRTLEDIANSPRARKWISNRPAAKR